MQFCKGKSKGGSEKRGNLLFPVLMPVVSPLHGKQVPVKLITHHL